MALYSLIEKNGDTFTVKLLDRQVEYKDDLPYLEYFANGGEIKAFMQDEAVWGEDLTKYVGFAETVLENVEKIKNGVVLL